MSDDGTRLPAPGIGEVYRLLVRLEQRINSIDVRLESKVVTLDVYQVAHQNLTDKVANVQVDMEHHLVEHAQAKEQQNHHQSVMLAAVVTAGVSLVVGVSGVLVGVLH